MSVVIELEAENPQCVFVGLAHLTEVILISNMSCRQFDNGTHDPIAGSRCRRAAQTLTSSPQLNMVEGVEISCKGMTVLAQRRNGIVVFKKATKIIRSLPHTVAKSQ